MKRLRDLWLALPWLRMAVVILVAFLLGWFAAGCAPFRFTGLDADILVQDENSCQANPHPLPACVWGLVIFGKWKF